MERAMLIDKRLCPRYTSDQTKRKSGENPQRMHLLSHKGRAAEGPSSNPWQTKNTQCTKGTKGKDRVVPLELSGRLTQQSLAVANPWGLYNSLRRMPLSQTPCLLVNWDFHRKPDSIDGIEITQNYKTSSPIQPTHIGTRPNAAIVFHHHHFTKGLFMTFHCLQLQCFGKTQRINIHVFMYT